MITLTLSSSRKTPYQVALLIIAGETDQITSGDVLNRFNTIADLLKSAGEYSEKNQRVLDELYMRCKETVEEDFKEEEVEEYSSEDVH